MSWRDILKVHPAAELFPLMSPDELKALGEDIKRNGLLDMITLREGEDGTLELLDGRNRLDAMAAVGYRFELIELWDKPCFEIVPPKGAVTSRAGDLSIALWGLDDPYAYVISANIHRRHLTGEQKRELIEKLLKANPERSDRSTAKIAKVSDKTVAAVRAGAEASAEIPHIPPTDRIDAGGRNRARKTPPKPKEVEKAMSEPGPVSAKPKAEAGAAELDPDPDRRRFQIRLEMGLFHPPVLRGEMSQLFGDAEPRNAARLIEAIVGGLSANTKRLADIPEAMRVAMARGMLAALGVSIDDLKPISPAPASPSEQAGDDSEVKTLLEKNAKLRRQVRQLRAEQRYIVNLILCDKCKEKPMLHQHVGDMLDPVWFGKFAKLAGMMGSDNEQERHLAADHAHKLLQGAKLRWSDIL